MSVMPGMSVIPALPAAKAKTVSLFADFYEQSYTASVLPWRSSQPKPTYQRCQGRTWAVPSQADLSSRSILLALELKDIAEHDRLQFEFQLGFTGGSPAAPGCMVLLRIDNVLERITHS